MLIVVTTISAVMDLVHGCSVGAVGIWIFSILTQTYIHAWIVANVIINWKFSKKQEAEAKQLC